MREPDLELKRIDGETYLKRWWIIKRNNVFNVYLHQFLHSDDDRALHDHPYRSLSIILKGGYWEHRRNRPLIWRGPGSCILRGATAAHRVELDTDTAQSVWDRDEYVWNRTSVDKPAWTLFITGPRVRSWGFWCPTGWQHWHRFTLRNGCGEQ